MLAACRRCRADIPLSTAKLTTEGFRVDRAAIDAGMGGSSRARRRMKVSARWRAGGISVQGVDAHDAWRIAYGLARKLSLPVEMIFEWRDKEGAAHPGEIGNIGWTPQSR